MNLKITKAYCWYDPMALGSPERVVKMYFLNGIAFTWDELSELEAANYSCKIAADTHKLRYTPETLFRSSGYLVMEECHPCFFELELENPEMLAEIDE